MADDKAPGLIVPGHIQDEREADAAEAMNLRLITAAESWRIAQDKNIRAILYAHMGKSIANISALERRVSLTYDGSGGFRLLLDGREVAVFGEPYTTVERGAGDYYSIHMRQKVRVIPLGKEQQ